jgi:hypothetical protein
MPRCSPIHGKCIIKRSALSEELPARLRPMSGFDPSSRPWSGRPSFRTTMLAAIPEHAATPANAKRRLLFFLDMILRSTEGICHDRRARGLSAFSPTFYMPAKLDMRNAAALRSFERPSYVPRWRPDWLAGAGGFEPPHQESCPMGLSLLCGAESGSRSCAGPRSRRVRDLPLSARHDSSKPAGHKFLMRTPHM